MAWYDNAVFYHIYPLGLCGCAHENDGQAVPGAFNKLNAWAEHAADIGCTAIISARCSRAVPMATTPSITGW